MPISKPIYNTRSKLRNLSINDIKRNERPLTRELMQEIRNLNCPFEFKENPDISSDTDTDESYIDYLGQKQQIEECITRCIDFCNLLTTNNFKHIYDKLKLEDIENENIRGYFNGICNEKYEKLNKQYEIEKTERLQKQIRQIKEKEYGTSFGSHILITMIFIFLGYLMYNHTISLEDTL